MFKISIKILSVQLLIYVISMLAIVFELLVFNSCYIYADSKKGYEEDLISFVLSERNLKREDNPNGKIIERIEIYREDIISKSDPWPLFLNNFHMKTKDQIIKQELLINKGEYWNQDLVDESERNLRSFFILSLSRIIACKSDKPNHVILLIVTKDLWSFRLGMDFLQVGTVMQYFNSQLTEQNFMGLNNQLTLHLDLKQLDLGELSIKDRFVIGQSIVSQRIAGSRFNLTEVVRLTIKGNVPCTGNSEYKYDEWCPSKKKGSLEGFYGVFNLSRPLYSKAAKWAFSLSVSAETTQIRQYRYNSSGHKIPEGEITGVSIRNDAYIKDDEIIALIPRVYDAKAFNSHISLTRSFGTSVKYNLSTRFAFYHIEYNHPGNFAFNSEVTKWHKENILPKSETAAYLSLGFKTFSTKFTKLKNIYTFMLSEDYRLGHFISAEIQPSQNIQDLSHKFLNMIYKSSYSFQYYDNLFSFWLNGSTRWQFHDLKKNETTFADKVVSLGFKNISSRIFKGRIHFQAKSVFLNDMLNISKQFLGSSGIDMLRGYPANFFEGDNLFLANCEYRSQPLSLYTIFWGLVLFYDGGSVYGGEDYNNSNRELPFIYHHSIGMGLRILIPQFNKDTIRIDFGIPLSKDHGSAGTWLSLSFGQAI